MTRPFSRLAILVTTALLLSGCATRTAITNPNPTDVEVQQVRHVAVTIAEGARTALVVIDQAASLLDSIPGLPLDTRNVVDCAIIRATGTTKMPSATVTRVCGPTPAPGTAPVVVALKKLGDVTAAPSLKTTVAELLGALDPVILKLEESKNGQLASFAAILRAALAFSRSYIGGVK